jgi:hypothetical protein
MWALRHHLAPSSGRTESAPNPTRLPRRGSGAGGLGFDHRILIPDRWVPHPFD